MCNLQRFLIKLRQEKYILCLTFAIFFTVISADESEDNITSSLMDDDTISNGWIMLSDDEGRIENISLREQRDYTDYSFEYLKSELWLYTRNNKDFHENLHESNLTETKFNSSIETLFILHGWAHNGYKTYIIDMKDEYLNRSDMNVIIVDWSKIASKPYTHSRMMIDSVANDVASFINFIRNVYGYQLQHIHMLGFSLGAHVAGLTGKKMEGGKLATIIGIEPALPLFSKFKPRKRLDKEDATYVEVIHTSGGTISFMIPLGHVDFYPNGGRKQPSCLSELYGGCSHVSAPPLFVKALKEPSLHAAVKCQSMDELARGYCSELGIKFSMGDLTRPVSSKYFGIYWLRI